MARILIADDEAILTMYLEEILSMNGHDVVGSASSGQEAIDLATALSPDIIIMDITMPGELDGIEAAEIIRSSLGIPSIFMTAHSELPIIEKSRQADPYGYLVKPVQNIGARIVLDNALSRLYAERKLRENEKRFSDIVYRLADRVWVTDKSGRHTYAMKEFEALFQTVMDYLDIGLALISPDMEVILANQTMDRWFPRQGFSDNPKCYHVYRNIHQNKPCPNCTVVLAVKDGRIHETTSEIDTETGKRHLRRISFPVMNPEGDIVAAIDLTKDITGRKLPNEHQSRIS
jgi:CheY-like chemotaxis protein